MLWQNKPRGPLTVGIALGSLLYSGINSLGWGLVNDPILAGLFVFVTAFSSWGIYWLLRN